MTVHRYGAQAVAADYVRSGAGLVMTLAPLVAAPTAPAVAALLGVGAGLFGMFGAATVVRHLTRIDADDDGLHVHGPRRADVPWRSLRSIRLAYFSTRRDGGNGWLQLTLQGHGRRVRIDSRIGGFARLAARAVAAAAANGVALDPATAFNFQAIGIPAPAPAPNLAAAAVAE